MSGKVQRACIELRAEGYTPKEISVILGKSETQIYTVCKRLGLQTTESEHQRMMQEKDDTWKLNEPQEYISRYTNEFTYHHGYVGCDKKAWVICNNCLSLVEISMVTIRQHQAETQCPVCKRLKRVHFKKERTHSQGTQKEWEIVECKECGKQFIKLTNRDVYCSDKCRHKHNNRKKDHRIPKDKMVSKDITLAKLYKRDNGMCWVCGGICDYNASINSDEYPSIDHIVAVSQGGEHSWENVRLAHRGCNLKRYNTEQRYAPL